MINILQVGIDKECMEGNFFARLETHLTIGFSWKTNLNALVQLLHLLNKAKSQLFQSIMNFKNFESHLDLVCQPAIRPSCARCRALKITQNNRLLCWIYKTVVLKTIF